MKSPKEPLPKSIGELVPSDLGVCGDLGVCEDLGVCRAGELGFVAQETVVAIEEVDNLRRLSGLAKTFPHKGPRADDILSRGR